MSPTAVHEYEMAMNVPDSASFFELLHKQGGPGFNVWEDDTDGTGVFLQ